MDNALIKKAQNWAYKTAEEINNLREIIAFKATEILKGIDENKKNVEFMPTGFVNIDRELDGGFLKKEIIILGAFTGIGKSFFAGQIFYNLAAKGFKSAYFSLEISKEMIVSRLVGQLANIKPTRIMSGMLQAEEYDEKSKARAKVTMFDDTMDFYDDLYLLSEIHEAIKTHEYEFVVIDFIQNILLENGMDEYARLSYIAIQLQKIAKETNCCIMVLSQLSNSANKAGNKVVEYKGSGAIAMIADLGFFIERGDPILDFNGQPVGNQPVKLSLRKNRRGISGLAWNLEFTHPGGLIIEK